MTIDIAAVRRQTPGVDDVLHFNNAGAGRDEIARFAAAIATL